INGQIGLTVVVINGEVARHISAHRSRDKWNETDEQESSGAKGNDSFRCKHKYFFLSSEFESDSNVKREAIRGEAQSVRLGAIGHWRSAAIFSALTIDNSTATVASFSFRTAK